MTDNKLSQLESELSDLEDEIAQVEYCLWLMENCKLVPSNKMVSQIGRRSIVSKRTLTRLTGLKELAELKLSAHKERTKESGVKW